MNHAVVRVQDTNLQTGLIIATAFTGGFILLGALLYLGGGRKVRVCCAAQAHMRAPGARRR